MNWPVLCFPTNGDPAVAVSSMQSLRSATARGFKSGWYANLKIIDAEGNCCIVTEATIEKPRRKVWLFLGSLVDCRISLRLDYLTRPDKVGLDEFKKMVCADLDKHREYYESAASIREWKSMVINCHSHREVIECLS